MTDPDVKKVLFCCPENKTSSKEERKFGTKHVDFCRGRDKMDVVYLSLVSGHRDLILPERS